MTEVASRAAEVATSPRALAIERPHGRTQAWWGMVMFITTEATLFACLLSSYFYIRFSVSAAWPPAGMEDPKLKKALIMTGLLLCSSGPMVWADHAVRHGKVRQLQIGLALTMLLGISFLIVQSSEYRENLAKFTWNDNVYGSLFYTITGFHGFHVVTGLVMVLFTEVGALRGKFTRRRHERIRIVSFYWHFIDAIWIFILFTIYLSPRL
jgi:cytochrome c oxidase subunit III